MSDSPIAARKAPPSSSQPPCPAENVLLLPQTQRSQVSAQARNRRLAAMQQLHDAGEFFSMEAMQERDPLLYQHYVGQYKDEDEELGVGGWGNV